MFLNVVEDSRVFENYVIFWLEGGWSKIFWFQHGRDREIQGVVKNDVIQCYLIFILPLRAFSKLYYYTTIFVVESIGETYFSERNLYDKYLAHDTGGVAVI